MIESAQYSNEKNTNISVVIDGKTLTVPVAEGNRHYEMLREWEAEGNTVQPYVVDASRVKTKFTSLEYLDRFTQQEQLDVISASYSDPQVKMFYDRLLAATFIDVNDPRTEMGLDLLISKTLLNPSRKSELMEPENV